MSNFIQIDGSQGEGGGQIVRSALALAMVTGSGFAIEKLRAGRAKPGLMRQHLTAVRAATEICQADVTGDAIGSSSLTFRPGSVIPGEYHFSVGTAGSATLVLQTVLPPLLVADRPSRLILEGGTHNPWAPPFDFLSSAFLPLINRMGPRVTSILEKPGFYPAGGGRFIVEIQPAGQLKPISLMDRGTLRQQSGRVISSNLPDHIAQREVEELKRLTGWPPDHFTIQSINGIGPGNLVALELEYENVTEVFTGFGEQGIKAEEVARRAVESMRKYLVANVPVGPFLADQLLLLLGITAWQTGNSGGFRTVPLTRHSATQINILRDFLGVTSTVTRLKQSSNIEVIVQLPTQ